ncbi:MAG TPA: phosphoglycerate dehydrogenase [Alphaproteobacteria bacterium]|nr:phosphoglycerate dehydrogenase [Alphaproteobacteria bacterium]HBD51046.1 phosphoglycerate dehydrogenase [Alphaproteobacteria bacterium]HBP72546.1 phosphoglycerate dehydrogenase [Alphaproteobacteria bacterium]HCA15416.1 phosphoglycerate dehydrogenase [Alphaproteobacteria bacterium]HCD78803.1 phosphoglycerate dehydrogenase [Alphaproteobacteria bacterium]
MPKVLISDKLSPDAAAIFEARGIEVDVTPGLTAEQLAEVIGDYDGLAIRSATKVTADLLAHATRLKVVGRAGIGVDNVDIPAATTRGVVVMNTPHGNAVTTAEHAITMMLSLARQIPAANESTQAGKWEKSRFLGTEITGKTLGLIGCGNIGSIVADRAQGLRMKVIGFDPFMSADHARDTGIEKVELDELLASADFISLHTPLTEQTRNILSADALNRTKKGVRIVNCARGGLIDELALAAALANGHVAGAALDVFENEPASDNVLFGMDNVVATPHLGASTLEAQEKVALQVAEQMSDYLISGAVTNALNMASVSAEEAPVLRPYMALGSKLGAFLGQVDSGGLSSVSIEFDGRAAGLNPGPVVASTVAGLLGPAMDSVNMVNATSVAATNGIAVSTVRHERRCDYETLLRVTVTHGSGARTIAGTLVGGDKARIVEVQDIPVESDFPDTLLYLRNYDKPGFIGDLGSLCGRHGINIATFHLGRRDAGGEAIALVEVDGALTPEVMTELRSLKQVVRVDQLHFSQG